MALSPAENTIWRDSVYDYYNPTCTINVAAKDSRAIRAANCLLQEEEISEEDCDYSKPLEQVVSEYMLEPDEVVEVLEIAKKNITDAQT